MMRYGHIVWRVIAVVAFAGTAALAVTLTRVPVRDHAALSSDFTRTTCAASGLQAWLGDDPSTPSTATYTLEFTNVSGRPCNLYGYPEVSAYVGSQAAGAQIGSAATRDTSVRPRPVVLAPGATAHSVLQVAGADSLQRTACGRVTAPELRVILPDRGRPALVPARFPACSRKGPAFMTVQPIQARAGVPGYPMP